MMRAGHSHESIALPKLPAIRIAKLASPRGNDIVLEMPENPTRLTPKQSQCLILVAEGMTSKEIARSLGLSARTVDDHIEKARIKLNAPSRQRAAALYRAQQAPEHRIPAAETAPYQLRCEPPTLDEWPLTAPIPVSTARLHDSGTVAFKPSPDVAPSRPYALEPKATHQPPSSLSIVTHILAIAAALAVIVLAYPQLIQGAEAIATFIHKTTATSRGTSVSR